MALAESSTPRPPSPTPEPTPGLPYAEDFADGANTAFEWEQSESDVYRLDVVNGAYLVQIDEGYYLTGGPADLTLTETRVQAEFTISRGSTAAGVYCRMSPDQVDFYAFYVADFGDGYLNPHVARHDADGWTLPPGDSLVAGSFGGRPLVGMLCLGSSPVTVIGFVNGNEVYRWDFDGPSFDEGSVGVYVDEGDSEVLFDNFLVAEP